MSEATVAELSDWAGARGERWRDHAAGLEATLAGLNAPLIEALRVSGPLRVAEIGCGCGATALALSRNLPEGSVVHGFDISSANVEEARRRVGSVSGERRFKVADLAFEVADMAVATPPDQAYDRLVSRFGFMFFNEPVVAFGNLHSWLVPGGRFAFATWGAKNENPWMTSVRETVAEIVELPAPDIDGPGPFRYGAPERLLSDLARAGFQAVEVNTWRGRLALGGGLPAADAARFALSAFGGVATKLAEAGKQAQERAMDLVTERLLAHEETGTVRMDAAVHFVVGARPA